MREEKKKHVLSEFFNTFPPLPSVIMAGKNEKFVTLTIEWPSFVGF